MLTDAASQEFKQNIARVICFCSTVSTVSAGNTQRLGDGTSGDPFTHTSAAWAGTTGSLGSTCASTCGSTCMWLGLLAAWQLDCIGECHENKHSDSTRQKLHGFWWHSLWAHMMSLPPFHHNLFLRIITKLPDSRAEDTGSTFFFFHWRNNLIFFLPSSTSPLPSPLW